MIFNYGFGEDTKKQRKIAKQNRKEHQSQTASVDYFNSGTFIIQTHNIYIALALTIFLPLFLPTEGGIACLSNPCFYGLCVDDVNSSYSCYCMDGYTGTNCQTEWDECWSQPCLNGGECLDLVATYNCTCPEGFSGTSCEFDRDECISQPCLNNATCVDGSNGFECHCQPGYIGSVCEWDISVCNLTGSERCLNGGACVEGPGDKFWCICTPGWGGVLCEEPLDPCLLLQPCLHGGLCLTRDADFICACPFGYTGARCEHELSLCVDNPCWNNAICVNEFDKSVCYCVPDYHGDLCQFQYDECLLPPTPSCKNGGTCIDGVDGFSCSCPPDVTGKYCECPLGHDCSNHSYYPILSSQSPSTFFTKLYTPTTEISHQESPSTQETLLSKSTLVTTTSEDLTSEQTKQYKTTTIFHNLEFISKFTTAETSEVTQEVTTTISDLLTTDLTTLSSSSTTEELIPKIGSSSTLSYTSDTSISYKTSTLETTPTESSTSISSIFLYPQSSPSVLSSTVSEELLTTPLSSSTFFDTYQHFSSKSDGTTVDTSPSSSFVTLTSDILTSSTLGSEVSDSDVSTTFYDNISSVTQKEASEFETTTLQDQVIVSTLSSSGVSLQDSTQTTQDLVSVSPTLHDTTLQKGKFTSSSTTSDVDLSTVTTSNLDSTLDSFEEHSPTDSTFQTSLAPQGILTSRDAQESVTWESVTKSRDFGLEGVELSTTTISTPKTTEDSDKIFTSHSSSTFELTSPIDTSTSSDFDIFIPDTTSVSTIKETTVHKSLSTAPSLDARHTFYQETSSFPSEVTTEAMISTLTSEEKTSMSSQSSTSSTFKPSTTTEETTVLSTKFSQLEPTLKSISSFEPAITSISPIEPTNCDTEKPCLNGGTCVSLGTGIQCHCPLQFGGMYCEHPSNISEVSLLPSSWLLFRVLTPAVETSEGSGLAFTHRLEATFRIVSEEGIIFTLAEAEEGHVAGYHMQMSLLRGRLRLQFSCGLQSVRFSESKQRIDNGHPTKISASLTVWTGNESMPNVGRCRAELKLNNSLAVSGEQLRPQGVSRRHAALAHLVFGAWPRGRPQSNISPLLEDDEEIGIGPAAPGVTACLSGVKVNGRNRLLLADVTAGANDVTECVQLACLSSPCLHGGTCEETPAATWSCRCPTGRLGARCETSVCANSPCEGGGTCLVHPGTNFVCLCPFGRQGVFCEQELSVSRPCLTPALIGVSPHIALPLSPRHTSFRHGMEFGFHFTAARTHQVSLLAYLGHGPQDHMAISYVHGRVMLTWDLGSGPRRMFTTKEFVAGVEHEVKVGRSGREAWMHVLGDNGTQSGHSSGKMTQLNTRPVLLIGGFDRGNSSLLPHDLPKHAGFEGCVSNIEIKTGSSVTRYFPPSPPVSPLRGRAVSQHGVQVCASNPCLHRGICLPHGPSFTCLCPQGWFGPVCAEPQNPCDLQTSLCAEGSTCVPLMRGYECDCPFGKTGPFCRSTESRNSIVWPEVYLSGHRSYLEVAKDIPDSSTSVVPEHSCVEFEMRLSTIQTGTETSAAQVLFFSQDSDSKDYMTLILTPDRHLQLLLGSGDGSPMSLRSPRGNFVRPGTWVRVRAGRVGRRVFLSIAGRPVSSWLLPGQAGDWSGGNAPLYIGGAPDLASVAPLVWLPIRPFTGCMRRIHVDWRKVLVHLGRAKTSSRSSRNVGNKAIKEPAMAQLTPEYMRQVQLAESWSPSSLGEDFTNYFQHESLAAFVSGQREKIQNWNPKHEIANKNPVKHKSEFPMNSIYSGSKRLTPLSLVTSRPSELNKTTLIQLQSSEPVTNILESTTPPPALLSRSLRSRDALFVSTARNVKPCDKSVPALLQLEPCGEQETQEGCRNLQYQAQNVLPATTPSFHGNGWLMIKVPAPLKEINLEMKSIAPFEFLMLRFSATNGDGLIVWASQDIHGGSFVGVGLKAGRLKVAWGSGEKGTSTTLLSSSLADGSFHSVSVLWLCDKSGQGREAHVWVDGERGEVEMEHDRSRRKRQQQFMPSSPTPLISSDSVGLTIYLGGFPNPQTVVTSSLGHFETPLHGCIAELSWDDETAMLSEFISYPHQNVVPCN